STKLTGLAGFLSGAAFSAAEKRDYDQRFAARQLLFSRCDQQPALIISLRQNQQAADFRRCVRPA
ncbi:hypothetical protein, partial [Burkholderia perseverans]|uniref:hypothetical protein n=1 Tax=Burkholderia perseverans TaxID=2615214 RepID=UPI001FEEDB17